MATRVRVGACSRRWRESVLWPSLEQKLVLKMESSIENPSKLEDHRQRLLEDRKWISVNCCAWKTTVTIVGSPSSKLEDEVASRRSMEETSGSSIGKMLHVIYIYSYVILYYIVIFYSYFICTLYYLIIYMLILYQIL